MMKALRGLRDLLKRAEVLLALVAAVLGTYLAVATALRGAKYPSEGLWAPWSFWFAAILVAAVFVPLYALYKALDAYFESADKGSGQLKRDLDVACQSTVSAIAQECGEVNVNELCAQVWLCRDDDSFDRRARFFLPNVRKRSGVVWGKGKGIAGTAWQQDTDLIVELSEVKDELAKGDAYFDALDPAARYGMSAREMKDAAGYTGICAIRLFSQTNASRLLGIFVIDYTGSGHFECVRRQAESPQVSRYAGLCEEVLTDAAAIIPV